MPSWPQVLVYLPFLSETTAVIGLVITSALIVMLSDWRLSLLTLLVQYILANVLLVQYIHAEVALFKFIVGAMLCPVLFMSARRVLVGPEFTHRSRWKGGVRVWTSHEVFGVGLPFRFLAVVLVGLFVYGLLQRFALTDVPVYLNFAVYWLGFMGLLTMMLTGRPLKTGLGLLTFMTGFELYYVTIERGLVITGLLGVLHLMVALSLAYLILFQTAPNEQVRTK
jgi:hypothetical protein